MAKTRDILELIDRQAPFDIAEEWDNCGLQVGDPDWEVKKILTGLDAGLPIIKAAADSGADLVVTHHPLIMRPEKKIDFSTLTGSIIRMCAEKRISLISAHTNLDKAQKGLNDYFAAKIKMTGTRIFMPDDPAVFDAGERIGIGRLGELASPMPLKDLAQQLRILLDIRHLRIVGDPKNIIRSAAVCTGSGGSLVDGFIRSGADVYITGDMKYHEARLIEESGRALIDVGHFGSEKIAKDLLNDILSLGVKSAGYDIKIEAFKKEKDPFIIV